MTTDYWLTDPRPDLPEDSALWTLALKEAWPTEADPDGLYGVIRGFRCFGARLERVTEGKLAGRVALRRGDISEAEYAAWRLRYLEPHGRELTRLLDAIGNQALAGRVA